MIKKNKIIILLVVIIFILFLILFRTISRNNDIIEKMENINIGMSKAEVIQILGEPKAIKETIIDSTYYESLLYSPPSRISSTIPYVLINKNTNKVVKIKFRD